MWFLVVSYEGREYFCCSFHKSFFAGRESSKWLSKLDMLEVQHPGQLTAGRLETGSGLS